MNALLLDREVVSRVVEMMINANRILKPMCEMTEEDQKALSQVFDLDLNALQVHVSVSLIVEHIDWVSPNFEQNPELLGKTWLRHLRIMVNTGPSMEPITGAFVEIFNFKDPYLWVQDNMTHIVEPVPSGEPGEA